MVDESDRERDDSGQYAPGSITTADEREILDAIRDAGDPVVTAGEVAERVDASQQTVRRRLNDLHKSGLVDRKEVGARAVVWWLTPESESG